MNFLLIIQMAVIYRPEDDENYESWLIEHMIDNIKFSLEIWIEEDNHTRSAIICDIVKATFFIYILEDEFVINDIEETSKFFDVNFSETKYKLSSMDEKFMNKVREIVDLFDLDNNTMFSEMFAEFITPKFKLHFVD